MTGWRPTRWWRAVGPDGSLWCESSNSDEVWERARPDDVVQRLWVIEEYQWRDAPLSTRPSDERHVDTEG